MDHEPVLEPPLGAAAALATAQHQVAPALDASPRARPADRPGDPLQHISMRHVDGARAPARADRAGSPTHSAPPGPTTTVPPPLVRRKIGTPSARQASITNIIRQPARCAQHDGIIRGLPEPKHRPPRPASASIKSASSSARFSATLGKVRSRQAISSRKGSRAAKTPALANHWYLHNSVCEPL